MTRVRLPDTPVPEAERDSLGLDGQVQELVGLFQSRNDAESVIARAAALGHRCPEVLVVDQGSSTDCIASLEAAGLRVLRLPAGHGEGAALRAGMQLARELGYIGALMPGPELLSAADVDVLALAHMRAPEAMFMAVGPGEAVAGQEWVEAAMLAEGLEPPPLSDFQPPRAEGLIGRVERSFEKLVETCFSHPWGSPRVLPLQAMLRRDVQCTGPEFHIECLFLAVLAGVPTIEVEISVSPQRRVLSCRRAGAGLLARLLLLQARKRIGEGFGVGGGYAPPTSSPLSILLAAGLALIAAVPASGCVRNSQVVAPELSCEQQWPRENWPAAGNATLAWQQVQQERGDRGNLWMAQSVTLDDPGPTPPQKLKGALILGGSGRFRLRLVGPMGTAALDFVRAGADWQLLVPSMKLKRRGQGPLPSVVENDHGKKLPLRLDLLATVLHGTRQGVSASWQQGSCGVLEEFDSQGTLLRRLVWHPEQQKGLAREEFIESGDVLVAVNYRDYRMVGDGVFWPHHLELQDSLGGGFLALDTGLVRTDSIEDKLFALSPATDQQVSRE
jgi:hypothetical protein